MAAGRFATTMGDSESQEVDGGLALLGAVILVCLVAIGYVLFAGAGTGRLIAGGVVMAGAITLGAVQSVRNRSVPSLFSAALLVAGGAYGVSLAAEGTDPFADTLVVALVVLGLMVGLFAPSEPDAAED